VLDFKALVTGVRGIRVSLKVPGSAQDGRFTFIDGLRGLASLAVVFYHVNIAVSQARADWAPWLVSGAFTAGRYGVAVFFALSGFVIAYSIRAARIGPAFVGRFVLRRALRLDPPYVASIALTIVLTMISVRLFPDLVKEYPSALKVLAHVFYLQDLLRMGNIVDVYWTLCLEVQFYLLLVVLLGLVRHAARHRADGRWGASAFFIVAFPATFVVSVLQYYQVIAIAPPGTFLPFWFYFLPGALAWWTLNRDIAPGWFAGAAVLSLGGFTARWIGGWCDAGPALTIITASLILLAGRRGSLGRWLAPRSLQYLGTISYSLYLIHPIIGWRAVSVAKILFGPDLTRPEAWLAFAIGLAASLVGSHVFYCIVERPSHEISRLVGLATRS
jgi:peptidoglycan/LPS O-acetylase OafA/YrhL